MEEDTGIGLVLFFFSSSREREKGSSIVRIIFFSTGHCSFVEIIVRESLCDNVSTFVSFKCYIIVV